MKKTILILAILLLSFGVANAIEEDGFVLNVKTDGSFLKEIDGIAELPFDIEYTILLKNNNDRRCSARVFIDGTRVSPDGDFVIEQNSELELERFVTDLEKGRKFKFVPLDNPAIDDPARKENGLILVEFRLEKQFYYSGPEWDLWYDYDANAQVDLGTLTDDGFSNFPSEFLTSTSIPVSNDPNGATIAGSESSQKFKKVNYDFENEFVMLELRLRGIEETTKMKYCDPWDALNSGIDLSCFVFKKTDNALYWKFAQDPPNTVWNDEIPGKLMKALMDK